MENYTLQLNNREIRDNNIRFYAKGHKYEILVSTIYFNTEYFQKVRITMTKAKYAPVVLLKYLKKVLL